jgi:glycosyltransferase involved in cell wall biosynthesis
LLNKHLHIISFDVPYPPNYGGVIDVFYKVKALHAEGVRIHLHCFEYGRPEAPELERYCESVHYYKRNMDRRFLFSSLPYIVITRQAKELINTLLLDKYPILFEGLHSCFYLTDPRLKGRKLLVRTHNIEHDYYSNLAHVEKGFLKKLYFKREAAKLKKFERVLKRADHVLAISGADELELSKRMERVVLVSAFHPNETVSISQGQGKFALYHGNLEVGENNEAALFLVKEVFNGSSIPLVIAGKNPSSELRAAIATEKNIVLKDNIPTREIDELIRKAQLNVLPTFQATGIKLKLLAALYNGRHCLVNSPMVKNTGLEKLCLVCDTASEMRKEAERLFNQPFQKEQIEKRMEILDKAFSNHISVLKLMELIR